MSRCTATLPWFVSLASLALGLPARALPPTPEEISRAHRWAADNLREAEALPEARPGAAAPEPCLLVLANHGGVLLDRRPDGRPIVIGAAESAHGLLCHAPSEVVVRLPGAGRRFSAAVGVDANAGGGSIVFLVRVAGREAFRSGVVRCGEAGLPVSVDLDGARELVLVATDAGDGIACDHAAWGEATATLEDGTSVRLSALPLRDPVPPPRRGVAPPFSFVCDGRHSDALLPGWTYSESSEQLDPRRTRRTQTWADRGTGLEARCVSVTYADFPVTEWTVYLRNSGAADTPIIESVQALDARFPRGPEGDFVLHHNVGSRTSVQDYQPLETPLGPGAHLRIAGAGGRPTSGDLCYFDLEQGGQGVIIALGWPGQWAAHFIRGPDDSVRVVAGQERTRLRLRPGEEIRTPLVALLFWEGGDWIRAQNVWRRWMMAHNVPRVGGKPVATHYGVCFSNLYPRAEEEISVISAFVRHGIPLDYWFLDAGWYPCRGQWWWTGTWQPDPERFPKGVREVADRVHAAGMRFVLWFEPERAGAGSWLTENRPEWILGGKAGGLVDLGNPDAWSWVMERFDGLVTSEGVDVYRQDYNIAPLELWRANDAEDRQGITENRHLVGYLRYWDELRRRHPDIYIDSCASGGGRNDLESLRRSVPLLRSDCFESPTTQQAQTMGIASWMPYYGSGNAIADAYWFRSCIFPASRAGGDARDPAFDPDFLRRMIAECREVQRHILGDFYPLTPWSLDEEVWAAWQWDVPESGEGSVQAFRRDRCPVSSIRLRLRGLDAASRYAIRDFDSPAPRAATGRDLMESGLEVTLPEPHGAALFTYRKVDR